MGAVKNALVADRRPSGMSIFQERMEESRVLCESGLLPSRLNTPAKVYAVILKGEEIGIKPIHACTHIYIIDGKTCLSAELMLSLIYKACGEKVAFEFEEISDTCCRIRVGNRGAIKGGVIVFDQGKATTAGLWGTNTWKKYPTAMLRSRAISEAARTYFPDIICGMSYTPEEIAGDRAVMDDAGNVIDITEKMPVEKPVDIVVDKLTDAKPVAASNESAVLEMRKANAEKIFPDAKSAWDWLEKEMDKEGLSADQRLPLFRSAVGRRVADILQDIKSAKVNHEVIDADFDLAFQAQA